MQEVKNKRVVKMELYHGTSEKCAKQIMREGFKSDKHYNWPVRSKKGYVYLSLAYALFYAMRHQTNKLAIIKVEVNEKDLYPEDDFIMMALGKPKYSQEELDEINLRKFKVHWKDSIKYLGNVAVKPNKIKILGVNYFDGKNLIRVCDPSITPINFLILGQYYKELSEHIFQGFDMLDFKSMTDMTDMTVVKQNG